MSLRNFFAPPLSLSLSPDAYIYYPLLRLAGSCLKIRRARARYISRGHPIRSRKTGSTPPLALCCRYIWRAYLPLPLWTFPPLSSPLPQENSPPNVYVSERERIQALDKFTGAAFVRSRSPNAEKSHANHSFTGVRERASAGGGEREREKKKSFSKVFLYSSCVYIYIRGAVF